MPTPERRLRESNPPRGSLGLRPLEVEDEARADQVHAAVAEEGHEFLLNRQGSASFADYVAWLDDLEHGRGVPTDWVPTTFRVAVVGDDLVGRATVRHRLTERLESFGGHLGYVVAPDRRRRGHGTAILRAALELAAQRGIERALLTIAEDNVGSVVVADRCGATFDGRGQAAPELPVMRRYSIPTRPRHESG